MIIFGPSVGVKDSRLIRHGTLISDSYCELICIGAALDICVSIIILISLPFSFLNSPERQHDLSVSEVEQVF